MPAVLTHKSTMLLARERLREMRDLLRAKVNSHQNITSVDRRMLALTERAHELLSTDPRVVTAFPDARDMRLFGAEVSKFAVMGSIGPDITGFSALLAPGQAWVFDTIHKGYPDENREAVVAGTCELIFEFWRRVSARMTAEISDADQRKRALNQMRAFVLGHLCHIATDVLTHPLINDFDFHASTAPQGKLEHGDGEVSHDARVAQLIFKRPSTREGAAWDDWWPALDEVPSQFFDAYAEAIERTYTPVARRRTGFAEFEDRFLSLAPPLPTADFVRDGYRMYRGGIIPFGYDFGMGKWFAVLLPLSLPLMIVPLLAAAPYHSRMLVLRKESDADSERAWCELLGLSLSFGSVSSLVYQSWVASLTTHGVETQSIAGLVLQAISVALGISFLATLGTDMPLVLRWLLFVILPGAMVFAQLIIAIVDVAQTHKKRRSALAWLYAVPPILLIVSALIGVAFSQSFMAAEETDDLHPGYFVLAAGLNLIGWLVTFLVLARYVLRDAKIPEYPKVPVDRPHHVRLFDDTTLFFDPAAFTHADYPGGVAPKLIGRFFPSGQRELLKLWWTGAGDIYIRVDRYQLVFSANEQGTGDPQIIPSPIGPVRLSEFAQYITATVRDGSGQTGHLMAQAMHPLEPDYELPSGAVFADHGDFKEKLADHNEEAAKFKKLGTTPTSDYILYHAPKSAQAIRFGRSGPVMNPRVIDEAAISTEETNSGYRYVYDPIAADSEESLMKKAADMAAMLCMGAVPHLDEAPEADRVYQVFRNWNLDRRRVNEWRMLAAGHAFSEKGADLNKYDPAMLRPPNPNAWTTKLAGESLIEGERTAREMGWVPLMREWLDMARRPGVDSLADERLRAENPPNRALSRAMAYLFDLAEPAAAP
jgi:hypothetical protein